MELLREIKPAGWLVIAIIALAVGAFVRHTIAEYSTYTPEQKQEFWEAIAEGVNQGLEAGSSNQVTTPR